MPTPAVGSQVQLAVLPDQPFIDAEGLYDYNCGAPNPVILALSPPGAVSAAAGASGNITASRSYKNAWRLKDMSETTPSTATSPVTLSAQKGAITAIPKPTDSRVMETVLYGSDDAATYGWVGSLYHYITEGVVQTTGTGLNDLTTGGTYTGVGVDAIFEIQITAAGTPDVFKWRLSQDNGTTWGSYTTGVNVTGSAQTLGSGVTITFAATTGHTNGNIWQVSVWSTKFNDNIATPDYSRQPRGVNQVAGNWGFRGFYPEAVTMHSDFKQGPSTELKGNLGPARYFPAVADFVFDEKHDLRPGLNAFSAMVHLGKYDSLTMVPNEPTFISVFKPSTAWRNPRSFSAMLWEGGVSLRPEVFQGIMLASRSYKFASGKVISVDWKPHGNNSTRVGFGVFDSGTGTYWDTNTVCARGIRTDAAADTTDIYGEIVDAPSAGTFTVKLKTGSGASFGGSSSLMTFEYDTTTTHQIRRSGDPSPWVEAVDENGQSYGADVGENRGPFELFFPGDVTTLDAGDTFHIPYNQLIPGAGTNPFTGVPLRHENEFRLTAAHIGLTRGVVTADTMVELLDGQLDISWTLDAVRILDAENKTPKDYDRTGILNWKFTGTRRYDSRYYQSQVEKDERLVLRLGLVGPQIIPQPGTVSTYRRGVVWDCPQVLVIETPKRSITNRSVVHEALSLVAEQPDDETQEVFTETCTTDRLWLDPAA